MDAIHGSFDGDREGLESKETKEAEAIRDHPSMDDLKPKGDWNLALIFLHPCQPFLGWSDMAPASERRQNAWMFKKMSIHSYLLRNIVIIHIIYRYFLRNIVDIQVNRQRFQQKSEKNDLRRIEKAERSPPLMEWRRERKEKR